MKKQNVDVRGHPCFVYRRGSTNTNHHLNVFDDRKVLIDEYYYHVKYVAGLNRPLSLLSLYFIHPIHILPSLRSSLALYT